VVEQLGRDPQVLFEWVRDNTWWIPYRGVLRGPAGVLMDRLGNSLDRSLLLDSRLASHAAEEARQKQCAHLLTLTLTRKRAGGGAGLLGKVVGQAGSSAAWGMPIGSVGGAVARGATVATTQAISELASSTKARDEVRLDYTLTSAADGKTRLGPKTDKAKAKADGEDLLTPMVERAAEAIAAVAK
jgi:hypothetical protein